MTAIPFHADLRLLKAPLRRPRQSLNTLPSRQLSLAVYAGLRWSFRPNDSDLIPEAAWRGLIPDSKKPLIPV